VWKAAEQAAREAVAPDTVLESIRDVRQTLREAKLGVEQRRDGLLSLQAQVAEEELRARAALDALTAARDSFRSLLFLRDSAPLWTAARQAPDLPRPRGTHGARWRARALRRERARRLGSHLLIPWRALATFTLRRARPPGAPTIRASKPRA
jgi:hypothetical protein